ncbi:MAG: type II secretion system protein GspC [Nevskia sp.]|nr:type II secretion system protein GspC [Nevskia sp.]
MASLVLHDWSALPKRLAPLYARYGRWLPAALDLLLILLIARLLAELAWALVPRPAAAAWQPPPAPVAAVDRSAQVDLQSISAAQLFGQYQAPANPNQKALARAPDTQLNLTLLGVFVNGRDSTFSRALIDNGGDERPFSIGDQVTDGVILKAIFTDRVVLARNGALETLRLDKSQAGTADATADDTASASEDGDGPSLGQIRSDLLANPQKAADYIRVMPASGANGSGQTGYRIYPGKDRAVFTATGLRPGDLVTAINGVQLNDPSKSLQLLSELSQASQVAVTVQRGGQPETINVNLGE